MGVAAASLAQGRRGCGRSRGESGRRRGSRARSRGRRPPWPRPKRLRKTNKIQGGRRLQRREEQGMEERGAYLREQGREDQEGQRMAGAQQQPGAEGTGRRVHGACGSRGESTGKDSRRREQSSSPTRREAAGGSRAEARARLGEEPTAEATDRRGGERRFAGPAHRGLVSRTEVVARPVA
jgi:hypothetical protein